MKLGQQIGLYVYPSTDPEVIALWEKLGKGTVAKTIFLALIEKRLAIGKVRIDSILSGLTPRVGEEDDFEKVRLSPNEKKHARTIATWNGLPKKLKSRTFVSLLKEAVRDVMNTDGEIEIAMLVTTDVAVIPDLPETTAEDQPEIPPAGELDSGNDENPREPDTQLGSLLGSVGMDVLDE